MIYPNVQKAIDILNDLQEDDLFDMNSLDFCIAGHIDNACKPKYNYSTCFELFADFTGVPTYQAEQVVYPEATGRMCGKVENATKKQAIQMLEILRDSGEVRWDLVNWN